MTTALDNLIGSCIRPVVVVFMPTFYGGGYTEFVGSKCDTYTRIFVEEILPLVERTYRVLPGLDNRANIGHLWNGFMAFYSIFKHRDLFGKLSLQSMWWDEKEAKTRRDLLVSGEQKNLQIYFDWGKYDIRSPLENISIVESNRSFAALLKSRGFRFTGGEVHAGGGWGSWKNRIDRVFGTFFPLSGSGSN